MIITGIPAGWINHVETKDFSLNLIFFSICSCEVLIVTSKCLFWVFNTHKIFDPCRGRRWVTLRQSFKITIPPKAIINYMILKKHNINSATTIWLTNWKKNWILIYHKFNLRDKIVELQNFKTTIIFVQK